MAKKSSVEKDKRRRRMTAQELEKRTALRKTIRDKQVEPEDRFEAVLQLAKLPRNGSKTRVRNRCVISGRPRSYYRKFGLSRIALRELALEGKIPGVVKASW